MYTYDTLYYLNKKLESSKEYPPQLVNRGIRLKVYEDDLIIQDKCERIAKLFHIHSSSKINGKSKAMIVTSSRLAAVKYKTYLDIELKKNKYPYESLVAFTGTVSWISKDEQGNERSENYTEDGMNSSLNPKNEKTERLFERDPNIRFLIVANKFQTGFNEPLLHTMFLDKPVRDKSAVQTLSRLNRIYPGKNDTLVVDFTGLYDQIMKAYNKYQGYVVSHFNPNPDDLIEIKNALLRFGIFTESDVKEIGSLILKKESIHLFIGLISTVIEKFKSSLTEEQRNEFRTLMIRFIGLYNYINNLYKMPNNDLIHYQLFLILLSKKMDNQDYSSLKKELESVFVQHYDVIAKDIPNKKEEVNGDREGERVRNSGGATSVKKLKTVQQVVIEINEKFMKRVGKVGMNIIEEFMNKVSQDPYLQEIIKNNINNQFDIVYTDIMKPKLLNLYHELILNKAPDEYEKLNSEDIVNEVFHKAYDYIRDNIKVA